MTTLRLALLAMLACLLMPAGVFAQPLPGGWGGATDVSSCGVACEASEGDGDEDAPVVVGGAMSPDDPDDDDDGVEDAATALPLEQADPHDAVTEPAVFGQRTGLVAALGVRYGLFRPPRAAG